MRIKISILLILVFIASDRSFAKNDKVGKTYAILIGGINKDPDQIIEKTSNIIKFQKYLERHCKLNRSEIITLVDTKSYVSDIIAKSNIGNIKEAFDIAAKKIDPNDTFVFYYTGQANIVTKQLRINLPGKDITGKQLAVLLNSIKAKKTLIILDCPGAGAMLENLKGTGKIVICSARADQPASTRFGTFLMPALYDIEADFDEDGRISILESFQLACFRLDEMHRDNDMLLTETPLLEDNGDGVASQQPWRFEEFKNDGEKASKFFLINE